MDMQPIDPNRQMQCNLAAEQWNIVLAALNELPHRVARPIVDALMQQLRQQSMSAASATEDMVGALRNDD